MDAENSGRRHATEIHGTRSAGILTFFSRLAWGKNCHSARSEESVFFLLSWLTLKGNHIVLDFLGNLQRTHYCGAFRASDAGKPAIVLGWVARRRDLGNLLFLDVRDRTGIVQVVFNKETQPEAHAKAEHARSEFVVAVEGNVVQRQEANPDLSSGEVELVAAKLHILNNAKTPPFPIEDEI